MANNNIHDIFVDRGDTTAWDFQIGSLTTDGTWRDLDLSSIVLVEAKAVLLKLGLDDNATSLLQLRKNGNSNAYNVTAKRVIIPNTYVNYDVIVACDINRIIEYNASNTTWTSIDILVRGWWI